MPALKGSIGTARLPADVNRFVGRGQELDEARRLLSSTRLITLTGVGGVGKTRLALHIATDRQRAFPDGVTFVELADLRDPRLLDDTVATNLGLAEQFTPWRSADLVQHIGDKNMLLVLDNCEHLIDAVAKLVDGLLRGCPELVVLATSREALRVSGERLLPLAPLPVPDPDRLPAPEALIHYDAVALFHDRAATVLPGFEITQQNFRTVARLCDRLSGIPLALELAAARLRVLSLDDILSRLDYQMRLLTSGSRTAPLRQQTLQASIDWSFDLCTPAERTLWSRLSVFPGSFELDAAESVCTGDGIERDDVLPLLASLVDKSILQTEGGTSHTGFRMLEVLRQYGEAKLPDAERETLRLQHRDWCADLVNHIEQDWLALGVRQYHWIARLHLAHASLRAALDFCVASEEADVGLHMVVALEHYWFARGLLSEGRHWLGKLLARSSDHGALRSRALRQSALLAIFQGDLHDVGAALQEAETLARLAGNDVARGYAAQTAGIHSMFQGDLPASLILLEQARSHFRSGGEIQGEVMTLFYLGYAASLAGDVEAAAAWHRQCLAITEPRGELRWRSNSLWALGLDALRGGDIPLAKAMQEESLRLKRGLGYDQAGIALSLDALSSVAEHEHDDERAAILFGAAGRMFTAMGARDYLLPALTADRGRLEKRIRAALGERRFRAATERGKALSLRKAIGLALNIESPASPPPTAEGIPLTKREKEIAELVADGLSNREIARRLVISIRTAETHIEHIFGKLGVNNRAQVAAWVVQRRTLPPN